MRLVFFESNVLHSIHIVFQNIDWKSVFFVCCALFFRPCSENALAAMLKNANVLLKNANVVVLNAQNVRKKKNAHVALLTVQNVTLLLPLRPLLSNPRKRKQ